MLAAGGGRRYGGPKALVRLDGRLLVERAAGTLRAAGCAPVVVVLGAGSARVRAEADLGDAVAVDNPGWSTGMGSSLRAGLAALGGAPVDAAVVLLVAPAPGQQTRVGFTAGRQVGGAVQRNRARRLLREAWRAVAITTPGLEVVLVAQPGLEGLKSRAVEAEVRRLLRRAGVSQ